VTVAQEEQEGMIGDKLGDPGWSAASFHADRRSGGRLGALLVHLHKDLVVYLAQVQPVFGLAPASDGGKIGLPPVEGKPHAKHLEDLAGPQRLGGVERKARQRHVDPILFHVADDGSEPGGIELLFQLRQSVHFVREQQEHGVGIALVG